MIPQHILLPTDLSEHTERALDYAITLAKQLQARLTLLNVMHIPPMAEVHLTSQMSEIEAQSHRLLEAQAQRGREAGLQVETTLVQGTPWQKIVEIAQDHKAELIIMGTHGRTGIEHMLLGSVAEKVVRLAPCSVLVVRHDAEENMPSEPLA